MTDTPDPINILVGSNVRFYRKKQQIKARKFADSIGISSRKLQKYECGDKSISAGRIWQMSYMLNISIQMLFDSEVKDLDH